MLKDVAREIRANQFKFTEDNVYEAVDLIFSKYDQIVSHFERKFSKIRIVKIAKNMGFDIYQLKLQSEISSMILINPDLIERLGNDKIIVINENSNYTNKRLAIAREIGHYLFGFHNTSKNIEYVHYSTYKEMFEEEFESVEEALINRFASELLLPSNLFEQEYKKQKNKKYTCYYEIASEISKEYGIPVKTVLLSIKKYEISEANKS